MVPPPALPRVAVPTLLPRPFQTVCQVGKGSYGIVWSARHRQRDTQVAIKHIDRVFCGSSADSIRILRELKFLRYLKHPNIIQVEDVLVPQRRQQFNDVFIVFELMDADLAHLIKSETRYDDSHIRWIMYQLLLAVQYVHSSGVIHRDLKPGNVLVNKNCDVKLCDFGMARANTPGLNERGAWTDYVQSRWYRAPELICGSKLPYTGKVDAWAAGCIMGELLRRKPIFPGRAAKQQLAFFVETLGPPTLDTMSKFSHSEMTTYLSDLARRRPERDLMDSFPGAQPLAIELMGGLLDIDPDERLSAEEALRHPYFEELWKLPMRPGEFIQLSSDDFAFENQTRNGYSMSQLRTLMEEEIDLWHPAEEEEGDAVAQAGAAVGGMKVSNPGEDSPDSPDEEGGAATPPPPEDEESALARTTSPPMSVA